MSKKLILLVMAVLFVWGGASVNFAQAAEPTSITVESVYEAQKYATRDIKVFIANPADLKNGRVELDYDSELLEVTDVKQGEVLNGFSFIPNFSQGGKVIVTWASDSGISQGGTLFEITFRLKKAMTGITDLKISKLRLNNNEIQDNIINGYIGKFKGEELDKKIDVPANKVWTIKFNTAINRASANNHTIYVTDSAGKKVAVKITTSSDKKSVMVEPVGKYSAGEYTLDITRQIMSSAGISLKNPLRMPFAIN